MNGLRIGAACAALVWLAGCSTLASDGKRIDYGAAASKVPALELPPDLTAPSVDEQYKIPGSTAPAQPAKGGAAAGGPGTNPGAGKDNDKPIVAGNVLPVVSGAHMEHDKDERWLVVNESAENVWPEVEAFWQEMGLPVSSEDKTAGVMETIWAVNHAKVNVAGPGSDNAALDSAFAAGERDQYRTRLERDKDGVSTDVYITHRGIREQYSRAKGTSEWVARPDDPGLAAIMLQHLMVRFGASDSEAARAVAATAGAVPSATDTVLNSPEPAGLATLREVAGSTIIVLNDPFDRSWRKVGLALESAGLVVEDKDRDKGIYYLRPVKLDRSWFDKLAFWKGDEDPNHYRVNVKDGGQVCQVSIVDQNGASSKVSKQMLEAIYKNINQQQ